MPAKLICQDSDCIKHATFKAKGVVKPRGLLGGGEVSAG